jgi:hypothetical protein
LTPLGHAHPRAFSANVSSGAGDAEGIFGGCEAQSRTSGEGEGIMLQSFIGRYYFYPLFIGMLFGSAFVGLKAELWFGVAWQVVAMPTLIGCGYIFYRLVRIKP